MTGMICLFPLNSSPVNLLSQSKRWFNRWDYFKVYFDFDNRFHLKEKEYNWPEIGKSAQERYRCKWFSADISFPPNG